jgi:cephalosporin-C deacetylase-like acetyl esterase
MKFSRGSSMFCVLVMFMLLLSAPRLVAQFTYHYVRPPLEQPLLPHDVLVYQLRHYLLGRIAQSPTPQSATSWAQDAKQIRAQFLQRIFHGWPQQWINATPKFEEVGVIETGKGYRIHKFRYEVVPGYYAGALLYEPEKLSGRVPGILNVLGHDLVIGKAADYMQKICINFAKQQIMALSLEWIGTGELNKFGNSHSFDAHLNLVGLQDDGLFYLAMRKGLDYLASHPNVDPTRLGVTGLSGGGWQTVFLSGLDERVAVAVPVAGYSSLQERVEEQERGEDEEEKSSIGDLEQVSPDIFEGYDYTHLTALRAPRPTLLIYNANDDCCFRASLVKPLVFDAIRPIFTLYGKEDALGWYVNGYPGNHNYQRDNREQAYGFFGKYLQTPLHEKEIFSDDEIRTYDDLSIGFPPENLTLLSLAQKVASQFHRSPIPSVGISRSEWATRKRDELRAVLHYKPAPLARAWQLDTSHQTGISTLSYMFEMRDGLSLSGVLLKASDANETAPATLVLDDRGRGMTFAEVGGRVDRGEQVLAANLLFTDERAIPKDAHGTESLESPVASLAMYDMVFDAVGDRTLGIDTAEVIELAKWLRARSDHQTIRVETRGIRTQTVALLAAALEPMLFSEVVTRQGMSTFSYLINHPVRYEDAADLFCLDLYKEFDIDELEAMAEGVQVLRRDSLGAMATTDGQ